MECNSSETLDYPYDPLFEAADQLYNILNPGDEKLGFGVLKGNAVKYLDGTFFRSRGEEYIRAKKEIRPAQLIDRVLHPRNVFQHIDGKAIIACEIPKYKVKLLHVDIDNHGDETSSDRIIWIRMAINKVLEWFQSFNCYPVLSSSPRGFHIHATMECVSRDYVNEHIRPLFNKYIQDIPELPRMDGLYIEMRTHGGINRIPCGLNQVVLDPLTLNPILGTTKKRKVLENVLLWIQKVQEAPLRFNPPDQITEIIDHDPLDYREMQTGEDFWACTDNLLQEFNSSGSTDTFCAVAKLCFRWYIAYDQGLTQCLKNLTHWMHKKNVNTGIDQEKLLQWATTYCSRLQARVNSGDLILGLAKGREQSWHTNLDPEVMADTIGSLPSELQRPGITLIIGMARKGELGIGREEMIDLIPGRVSRGCRKELAMEIRDMLISKNAVQKIRNHSSGRFGARWAVNPKLFEIYNIIDI
jgi:hypothetical protein